MKIQIEAELSNYIESLHYDRNSIQELLLMAAKQGLKDTDAYNAWMKDYLGKSKEYEIAKATLEREFIIPAVGNAAVDWMLDFSTATVTVTPREQTDDSATGNLHRYAGAAFPHAGYPAWHQLAALQVHYISGDGRLQPALQLLLSGLQDAPEDVA